MLSHVLDLNVTGGSEAPRAPGYLGCVSHLGFAWDGNEQVRPGVNLRSEWERLFRLHCREEGAGGCTGAISICQKKQAAAWLLVCSGSDLERGPGLGNRCSLLHPRQHRGSGTSSEVPACSSKAALQPAPGPCCRGAGSVGPGMCEHLLGCL